jgi:hypothetical protein
MPFARDDRCLLALPTAGVGLYADRLRVLDCRPSAIASMRTAFSTNRRAASPGSMRCRP